MKGYEPEKLRSVALVAHAQAGKTSLSEAMLFNAKVSSRLGKVLEGNTASDYNPDEMERKISITLSCLFCNWKENFIYLIDTPGYADFIAEVIASLRAVDSVIVVIDAVSGVGVGTEKVWELLDNLSLPRLIFVNKMDKENTDFNKVLKELKQLSKKVTSIQSPFSKQTIEAIAETDDALLEKYLEGKELTEEELKTALRKATLNSQIFPLLSGSAINEEGIRPLLDAVVDYLPSPLERPPLELSDPKTNEEKLISPKKEGPLLGLVFKTISDPYIGNLSLFRIFSGSLSSNTGFYNSTKARKERVGQIITLQGKEQKPLDLAGAGDIAAVTKLKETTTFDTLADEKAPLVFLGSELPEPVISLSVKPKTRQDEEKISGTLSKLSVEDLTFKVSRDPQTKELIVSGLGDLHLDVMVERMKKRFNVEVELGTPKVPYKETITKTSKVQGKYKRQSGGRGQYGDVWIEIEPLPKGGGFEFVNKIVGGAIPRNYIPAVEKGLRQVCSEGVVAGYPLVNLRVTLYDGSFHPVDSSDIAFQIAGAMALRKAALEANAVLLEPIMEVEVVIPDEYMGAISGDISGRRGRILGMEIKGRFQALKADVPLAEMFKYASDLRSITGGRGSYSMSFSHYEVLPQKLAQPIITKAQEKKKE